MTAVLCSKFRPHHYRKSVIEKLGVKSISEAISVVMVHRML